MDREKESKVFAERFIIYSDALTFEFGSWKRNISAQSLFPPFSAVKK
jgi:hypothetical protein